MRLARALALAGIDSRRKCEAYIRRGEVLVNGEKVQDLGRQVDPERDEILFRGKPVAREPLVYFMLNKPAGTTTTAADPHAKKTVYELLPSKLVPRTHKPGASSTRVFPVGRLDRDSSGLLLFTNDGDLAHRLTHPRFGVGKWYEVKLGRALEGRHLAQLLQGVALEEGVAKVEKSYQRSPRHLKLLLREGKKREVRRIFEKLGYEVRGLRRISFGPLNLGKIPPGAGRFLKSSEISALKQTSPTPR